MTSVGARLDGSLHDCDSLIGRVRTNLQRYDDTPAAQRVLLDAELDQLLSQADALVGRMAADLRLVPPSDRNYYENEVRSAREGCSAALTELRQKRQAAHNSPEGRQIEQARRNVDRSEKVLDNLDTAIALGNDAITTGNRTLDTLTRDREILEHIDENLMHVHQEGRTGESRIKSMARRACCHKFLVWIIVVLLLIILGVSIWYKHGRKSSDNSGE
jgi:hypothetical protein